MIKNFIYDYFVSKFKQFMVRNICQVFHTVDVGGLSRSRPPQTTNHIRYKNWKVRIDWSFATYMDFQNNFINLVCHSVINRIDLYKWLAFPVSHKFPIPPPHTQTHAQYTPILHPTNFGNRKNRRWENSPLNAHRNVPLIS